MLIRINSILKQSSSSKLFIEVNLDERSLLAAAKRELSIMNLITMIHDLSLLLIQLQIKILKNC